MRKIEDEYYCGGSIFNSQDQLDQFKQLWQQKLKQQFVLQNQIQLKGEFKNQYDEKLVQINKKQDDQNAKNFGSNPRKILKKEQLNDEQSDQQIQIVPNQKENILSSPQTQCLSSQETPKKEASQYQSNKNQKIKTENVDNSDQKELIKQSQKSSNNNNIKEEEEIDFTQCIKLSGRNIKNQSKRKKNQDNNESDEEEEDDSNKSDKESNFSLNSEDLEDVSDQILDEGYFNEFDNHLIGYIGKERKTKKKCKEQNKPITCIDFQYLIGNINNQEVIIPSLRANFVDCRK
ncbi:hypothetical protein TTHERM_00455150 (macronuclear) [Tetrahymena thermophila SB210]|uniref:Uncharacterized protein n=1 Tax=Tetrahymena thermophila (strain SB210) TaxID=312017 RepID=I7MI41_TETTS|nr:hypothetical protein TTHERM_00455150 [Tetrahymena thermophila SB210]EAS03876.2 hypothetical protein TTHERM_00455150 [Tetrahymena thermophila SB210]|eukprot:XP_001024121.2 hypothetical protein TTHERM_00455150 [Tetrahymena thermophila SB210]